MAYKNEQAIIKQHLIDNGYEELSLKDSRNLEIYKCESGTSVSLKYPGYKWDKDVPDSPYDFRVDADFSDGRERLPSHAALMVDMYNKVKHCGMDGTTLREVLVELAESGVFDLQLCIQHLPYAPKPPLLSDLKYIDDIYKRDKNGGVKNGRITIKENFHYEYSDIDWPLEELLVMVKYIALQEDVNYPMAAGYEGRRMPFARYIEAIDVAQKEITKGYEYKNSDPTLNIIIGRALANSRVAPFDDIDYGTILQITE